MCTLSCQHQYSPWYRIGTWYIFMVGFMEISGSGLHLSLESFLFGCIFGVYLYSCANTTLLMTIILSCALVSGMSSLFHSRFSFQNCLGYFCTPTHTEAFIQQDYIITIPCYFWYFPYFSLMNRKWYCLRGFKSCLHTVFSTGTELLHHTRS